MFDAEDIKEYTQEAAEAFRKNKKPLGAISTPALKGMVTKGKAFIKRKNKHIAKISPQIHKMHAEYVLESYNFQMTLYLKWIQEYEMELAEREIFK